jgi:hypothetical protein
MSDKDNITLPRELVQEALEALQYAGRRPGGSGLYTLEIAALRAALDAPRPEPVAWLWLNDGIPVNAFLSRGDADDPYWLDKGYSTAPLYTAPPAAAPEPEPVAWQERHFSPKVGEWTGWNDCRPRMADSPREQTEQNGVRYQWRPLYAAPPTAAPEPVRHPGYVIGSHWFETAYERLCAGEAEDAILEDYEVVREPRLRDLRRDAERIGWLERNGIGCEKVGNIGFFVWRNGTRYAGDTPRAAIDAAMEDKTCAAIDAAMQEDRS